MGFRSYVSHFHAFSGCDFGASPSLTAMVFSYPGTSSSSSQRQEEKVAKIHSSSKKKKPLKSSHFLWVSEVTLGIFGVQFWGFSVLHCHGVFLSGDQQQQQQKLLQEQEEKVAKIHIHSSSKKKK